MKRTYLFIALLVLSLVFLSACGNSGPDLSIGDIESALHAKDSSFAFDTENKPYFQLIGASDGWMGYFDEIQVVKVYQFKDNAAYKKALEQYDILEPWPKVGNFVLETTSAEVEEIFKSLG